MSTGDLRRAIPIFPQPSPADAIVYYRERLGFDEAFSYDNYAGVRRGSVEIHFWKCDDRQLAEQTSCRIEVEGIDALYTQFKAGGVVAPKGQLELKPWGYREFFTQDPAGNTLIFGERPADYRA